MAYLDDFFGSVEIEGESAPAAAPVTPGIFTEAAETFAALSKAFDVSMMQVDAYMEACDREYNLHLKQAELKCLKEQGTMDDLAYLESAAEEGAVAKVRGVIDKLIEVWKNFISTVKTRIIAKIASAETRNVLSRAEKKVKLNPILARKKVKIRDNKKPLGIIKKYKTSTDKATARAVKGLFAETNMKTLMDSKENFREEFRNATAGEVALTTITVAALLAKLNSDVEKLPSYVDGLGKNQSVILSKLKVTVDGEAAAAATAATNACASFSNEIAKAEVNLVVDQIMNMISVLKAEVIRQKGDKEVKAIEESAEDPIDEGFAYQESSDGDMDDFEKMLEEACMESGDDIHTAAVDDFDAEEIFGSIFQESAEDDSEDAPSTEDFFDGSDFEESAEDDMDDFEKMLDSAIFEESADDSDDAIADDLLGDIFEEAAADEEASVDSDDMDSILGDILGV